jgi:N-acetylmuramoyl-L-alanine amidase
MKKSAADSGKKRVQRASVRRAQQAGRQRAAHGAQRVAGGNRAPRKAAAPVARPSGGAMPGTGERQSAGDASISIPHGLRKAFVLGLAVFAVAALAVAAAGNWPGLAAQLTDAVKALSAPSADGAAAAAPAAAATVTPGPQRVGVVSGHRGNDSGAVCADGLTEAEVNLEVALRVASLLRAQGYAVDILDEYDPRLKGYLADVLVSIHADSCAPINELATGFKVARVLDSKIPEQEDLLVACLRSRYQRATGLRWHANTVTYDMTEYHAFYEIDARTPAAIIETGFLYLDRILLTQKPELVGQGIVDGIACFMNGEVP